MLCVPYLFLPWFCVPCVSVHHPSFSRHISCWDPSSLTQSSHARPHTYLFRCQSPMRSPTLLSRLGSQASVLSTPRSVSQCLQIPLAQSPTHSVSPVSPLGTILQHKGKEATWDDVGSDTSDSSSRSSGPNAPSADPQSPENDDKVILTPESSELKPEAKKGLRGRRTGTRPL